ncbi:unnamed protein product [Moneuplotes crassus]|uniref:Uncharacterized protein n=1 Tax=Euplotes crassus TaxID=5936 RepID=A0AAD1XIR1_EUPCR|nr:unnamed protein product [Moneuplotes crassus]
MMESEFEDNIWTEKHRPATFKDLAYNQKYTKAIKRLINSQDFPHLLLYGPPGAGKRTFTRCILNEIFVLYSNYHIELSPTNNDSHDRIMVNNMIKETAESQPLKREKTKGKDFKIVVIHDLNLLSRSAQAGLRRTMEKYMSECRIIFQCESLSRVIDPLKSRCALVRVPAPTYDTVAERMKDIAKMENLSISTKTIDMIARRSKRNMRKAIMLLQIYSVNFTSISDIGKALSLGYEQIISEILKDLISEQSATRVKVIRNKFYQLISKGISTECIFVNLIRFLMQSDSLDSNVRYEITKLACEYDFRSKLGARSIFHLEGFICQAMVVIKKSKIQSGYGV